MNPAPRLTLDGDCLRVVGAIDPDNVLAIRKEGEGLIASHASGQMTVDLSGLGVAHSVVLSLLLCWLRAAGSSQKSLRLDGASERLQSLAALSGLDDQLPGLNGADTASP